MKLSELGEFGLIGRLRAKLNPPDPSVAVDIGDDAAVIRPTPGTELVITTDMLVEGVHFREDTIDFRSLGWKSMAASISDVAAMGGSPRHATISLAIPPDYDVEKLDLLYEGVAEIGRHFNTHVVGGDIVKTSGPLLISVTLTGEVEPGKALLRSGAKAGDLVFVTGTLGGSAAGLAWLEQSDAFTIPADDIDCLVTFHQRPQPQVAAGRILATVAGCTSCNDISDGLASELNEIAAASGVGMRIQETSIPVAATVANWAQRYGKQPTEWALFGGEDYQLVGTIEPLAAEAVAAACAAAGIQLTLIGEVTQGSGVILQKQDGGQILLQARGFNHFTE